MVWDFWTTSGVHENPLSGRVDGTGSRGRFAVFVGVRWWRRLDESTTSMKVESASLFRFHVDYEDFLVVSLQRSLSYRVLEGHFSCRMHDAHGGDMAHPHTSHERSQPADFYPPAGPSLQQDTTLGPSTRLRKGQRKRPFRRVTGA